MVGNALFAATIVCLALGFYLLEECRFLVPYRSLLYLRYGSAIALSAALVFLNVFALLYAIGRKFFLKDTGRKLAHLEKQLRTGESISEELTRRLKD